MLGGALPTALTAVAAVFLSWAAIAVPAFDAAIVVPARNESFNIQRCIESLLGQRYPRAAWTEDEAHAWRLFPPSRAPLRLSGCTSLARSISAFRSGTD
jgi:hypothetical protein